MKQAYEFGVSYNPLTNTFEGEKKDVSAFAAHRKNHKENLRSPSIHMKNGMFTIEQRAVVK